MAKKRRIVMQDIADRLNLSKNSVSQALSGKDGVSEETRRKIIQTAIEMGYRYKPKRSSDGRNKRVRTIGLIASEFAFSMKIFFGEIYLAIEREAQSRGIGLRIQSITPEARDRLLLPDFIEKMDVDGLLILSHISTEYVNHVLSKGIPTVLIDHHDPLIEADAVLTNNRFGAYLAVRHLLELGHRRIGILGNIGASPSYLERWEGYLLAMREYGIEPPQAHMLIRVREEVGEIGEALRAVEDKPSAWFCVNDGFAFFACSVLQNMGYAIPEDVSVCGFDNSDFSQIGMPKITTMNIDLNLFAKEAFAQLMRRIESPEDAYREILLPTRLVKRESTGPFVPKA
ncbi:MAG: LacI family transcriptional regulator [Thermobacillus sp. ZCTH02-B1]|uniref:substrate-binding domain-containing protein n=1 Tax=Thermobacillus sp. ZCTH02-B1 TaxID=1858795 RepID=UPI000B578734|nr:substrate-binding domain-containing protein [Thermobacillus sp. ZCTH02-B1]OUM94180.1 MAG: LacI family transcriptional regulator [Thermobacillus sp. ZCTH02-B1]